MHEPACVTRTSLSGLPELVLLRWRDELSLLLCGRNMLVLCLAQVPLLLHQSVCVEVCTASC